MSSNEKISQGALTIVGLATVVLAILGLWYNYSTLFLDYSLPLEELGKKADLTNFYVFFYTMSGICAVLYILLFAAGVQLIRRKTSWAFVLLAVVVVEIAYFLVIGWLWARSPNAPTIAAASGVSGGGLMYQVDIVFPIWGPLLALWARRRILATKSALDRKPSA